MKRKSYLPLALTSIVLVLAVFLMNSCSFSTANIASADFAKEVPGGKTEKIGTTYRPTDGPFHLLVSVANAPDGTKVKAVWYSVGTDNGKDEKIDEYEVSSGDLSAIDFNLSLPRPWPTGKYKVDLFLNDKLDRSLPFTVEP